MFEIHARILKEKKNIFEELCFETVETKVAAANANPKNRQATENRTQTKHILK